MKERIIALEKQSAFQEEAIHTLQDALKDQDTIIKNLVRQVRQIEGKVTGDNLCISPEEETPPPHY